VYVLNFGQNYLRRPCTIRLPQINGLPQSSGPVQEPLYPLQTASGPNKEEHSV